MFPVPCDPTPMHPITIRSPADGRLSCPRADAGMMAGKAVNMPAADPCFMNARRLIRDRSSMPLNLPCQDRHLRQPPSGGRWTSIVALIGGVESGPVLYHGRLNGNRSTMNLKPG